MPEQKRSKKQQTKAEREAAERREALRDRILMWLALIVGLVVLVAVFANATPEKQLVCDGGNTSLLQFGTCR